jgi:hypothetical protein
LRVDVVGSVPRGREIDLLSALGGTNACIPLAVGGPAKRKCLETIGS